METRAFSGSLVLNFSTYLKVCSLQIYYRKRVVEIIDCNYFCLKYNISIAVILLVNLP